MISKEMQLAHDIVDLHNEIDGLIQRNKKNEIIKLEMASVMQAIRFREMRTINEVLEYLQGLFEAYEFAIGENNKKILELKSKKNKLKEVYLEERKGGENGISEN